MFRGASTPILTELGPILTIVIEISSPIRIRSLIFRESTSIPFSLVQNRHPCNDSQSLPSNITSRHPSSL